MQLLLLPFVQGRVIDQAMINVTEYFGTLTMRHQEDVHEILETGHLIFDIDITKELDFVQRVEDKFFIQNVPLANGKKVDFFRSQILEVTKNPLGHSLQIVYDTFFQEKAKVESLLTALRRTLPLHHPSHQNYRNDSVPTPQLTRQKRQIPFLSLGLGVLNSVHLAVLDGAVAGLGSDVQRTMMRVNDLAKISAANAQSVIDLAKEQAKIIADVSSNSKITAATLLSISMLSAMQQGIRHLQTVSNGIQALLDFRLPLSYFDLDEVQRTFDKYVVHVQPQNLEPVNLSFLQLFQNHASFVLVEKEENGKKKLKVSVMVDLPLMGKYAPLTSVFSMEPTIVPINGSYWEFHAKGMLLAKPDGAMAEVGPDYLEKCQEVMGPMGRMCTTAPTLDEEKTCLTEIYVHSSNLTACHAHMKIMPPRIPYLKQRQDGSFLAFSPVQRHAHVDCPDSTYRSHHDSASLWGLQLITIRPGCRLRVGDFHGFVLEEPDIKPLRSFVIGENATQLLQMLQVNDQVLRQEQEDLASLVQENAHVLGQAEMTLSRVTALVNRPLHRATTQVLPFILMGISGVLLLMICSCIGYCCCKRRCKRRKLEAPPTPTKRKSKKGNVYTPTPALGIEHLMIDLDK